MYRGLKLPFDEFESNFKVNHFVNLTGYTSTTLKRDVALAFAVKNSDSLDNDTNKKSILLQIEFTGDNQFFYLNSKKYSAYPGEKEVLLQDGIQYKVVSVE